MAHLGGMVTYFVNPARRVEELVESLGEIARSRLSCGGTLGFCDLYS